MSDIRVHRVNNVYSRIECEKSIAMEISEAFTFEVPGARFQPAFKNKFWDGKIRLLNYQTRQIYAGLTKNIEDFARQRDYTCEIVDCPSIDFPDDKVFKFLEWLHLNPKIQVRTYQLEAFKMAIREMRRLFISPTASGKSLMIYLCAMYITEVLKKRVLIVVPSTQLAAQMYGDFLDYNNGDADGLDVYQIRDGAEKRNDSAIVISTWQAIQNQSESWYKPFSAIIGDEVHTFKATSLKKIAERCNVPIRLGFTGTLDGTETNELVLQGLFGTRHQVTTYRELREGGYIANPTIKCLILEHDDETRKAAVGVTYQDEMKIIQTSLPRREFMMKLLKNLEGNVLCLYQAIDNHLIPMHEAMIQQFGEDSVFKIHGSIKTDAREDIRRIFDAQKNAKLNASFQTCQQGINIINIDHIVMCDPTKSQIRLLQSMGRGLRRSATKTEVTIWDIADNLKWKKYKTNHTLNHMKERVKIYNREQFDYELISRKLRHNNG